MNMPDAKKKVLKELGYHLEYDGKWYKLFRNKAPLNEFSQEKAAWAAAARHAGFYNLFPKGLKKS
jgi:hypothetical protein